MECGNSGKCGCTAPVLPLHCKHAVHDSEMQKNGIAVNTWTVDEPEYIRAMFMLGVDSVITNKPDVAKSVRNELSNDAENTEN